MYLYFALLNEIKTFTELILRWSQDQSVISPNTLAHRKISSTQIKLLDTRNVRRWLVRSTELMCAILWVWDLVARMKRTKKYIEVWQTIFHRIKYTLLWVVWPETRWFDEHIRYCVREKFDNEIKSNMNSILITGCNRGLGLGIVKQLLASNKPTKHIFATCRNPDQAQVT